MNRHFRLYFLLCCLLLLCFVPLAGCAKSDEPAPLDSYECYESEQDYLDAVEDGESTADAYFRPKQLPETAEFDYIMKHVNYVATCYYMPFDAEAFGHAAPEDTYLLEQSTTITFEHWIPGSAENTLAQKKQILEMTSSVMHNGTEYFYALWDDCKYYICYIQDGYCVCAAIPAFTTLENLFPYVEVDIVLPQGS